MGDMTKQFFKLDKLFQQFEIKEGEKILALLPKDMMTTMEATPSTTATNINNNTTTTKFYNIVANTPVGGSYHLGLPPNHLALILSVPPLVTWVGKTRRKLTRS